MLVLWLTRSDNASASARLTRKLAAGQGTGIAQRVGLPGVHHLQLQRVAGFALQQVAPVQPAELKVGQINQMIERQPLSEAAELVAFFRADQLVEVAPVVVVLLAAGDLLEQRLLIETAGGVAFQLVAQLALAQLQRLQLLCQLGQRLRECVEIRVSFIHPFRAALPMLLQRLRRLSQQGRSLYLPLLQLLFALLQFAAHGIVQQRGGEGGFIGKFAVGQRLLPLLLRLLQPFLHLGVLLLQPGLLAGQTLAQFLRLLPLLGGLQAGLFTGGLFGAQLFPHLGDSLFAEQRQPLRASLGEGLLAFLPALKQVLLLLQVVGMGFLQQRKALFEQRQPLLRLLLLRLQSGERVFCLLYRLRRLFMLLQRVLPAPLFVVAAAQPGAEPLALGQRKVECQRRAELLPLLLLGSQLLLILRDSLLLALQLLLQVVVTGSQLDALFLQCFGLDFHLLQTLRSF